MAAPRCGVPSLTQRRGEELRERSPVGRPVVDSDEPTGPSLWTVNSPLSCADAEAFGSGAE
ncbi:hypothetical protein, partial [Streptomyces misionensis]|uniref:hypothetical protein n=1 Tax=Streptomyces misionensis TaxID=67331 RepID=UPI0036A0DA43